MHRSSFGLVLALCAPVAMGWGVPPELSGQAGSDRLTVDLFLDWEDVWPSFLQGGMGPELSPDGKQIIYARRYVDKMADRWKSDLWIMNADGTRNRFLTKGGGAVWSPDGTRIAFVREGEPSGAQIFVRWMDDEGATSQITRLEHGPGSIQWSPDGTRVAFTMMVPSAPELTIDMPARPAGAEWNEPARVVTRPTFRRDQVGYTDQGYRHLFVVDAEGGTPRQLTDGDWSHNGVEWTPDGSEILFTGLRTEDAPWAWRESEIYAVDVSTKQVRQLTRRSGPDAGPVVSPDGRLVAYVGFDMTDDTYITNKLYVMGIDGSNPRDITGDLDRSPAGLFWAPDGSGVYFNSADRGRENFHFASLDGETRQLTQGEHTLRVYSMSADGRAAGIKSSPAEPGDLVTFTAGRPDQVAKLTGVNDDLLEGRKLGEVEEIWYTSTDGLDIQGWIVKPPDFDPSRKYPLMLSIHGGPHGMYGFGTPYMWFEWQLEAARDYVVLYTNPRGSSGYGSSFGNEIKNAYPSKDYDDLMHGVDEVIDRGYVDTDNMFVYGCSGGGVLTAWVIGHTDRFAAASSECPVINWLSFVGTTDGLGWYRNFEHFPWEDPSEHLRRSPLMYVGNVTTPTILITGEGDLRTPMGQTEEYYQALSILKVPTAMVRLKDEWHAYFNRPTNSIQTWLYRMEWFDRYRKKGPVT